MAIDAFTVGSTVSEYSFLRLNTSCSKSPRIRWMSDIIVFAVWVGRASQSGRITMMPEGQKLQRNGRYRRKRDSLAKHARIDDTTRVDAWREYSAVFVVNRVKTLRIAGADRILEEFDCLTLDLEALPNSSYAIVIKRPQDPTELVVVERHLREHGRELHRCGHSNVPRAAIRGWQWDVSVHAAYAFHGVCCACRSVGFTVLECERAWMNTSYVITLEEGFGIVLVPQ